MRRNLVIAIMAVSALAVADGEVLAAGMTIPAGSSLNVNRGTLNVAGDIFIKGIIRLPNKYGIYLNRYVRIVIAVTTLVSVAHGVPREGSKRGHTYLIR